MSRPWPALLLGACCHQEARTDAPAATTSPTTTSASPAPAAAPAESIGTATMEADGTLVLQLRATGAGGMVGDPNYAAILAHVGPISPGESRPVAPFP